MTSRSSKAGKPDIETIDGAAIAAAILKRMGQEQKERVVRELYASSPELAMKVEAEIYSVDAITKLNEKDLTLLLRDIEHRDLVVTLGSSEPVVREHVLARLSPRRKQLLNEDIEHLLGDNSQIPLSKEVLTSQKKIFEKLEGLSTSQPAKKQGIYA